MSDRLTTWAALYARLGSLLAVDDADVGLWLREAVEGAYGVVTLRELGAADRRVAFGRACALLDRLEREPGDLAFRLGLRRVIQQAVERTFGVTVGGPPWRLDPSEDLPTRVAYEAEAGF